MSLYQDILLFRDRGLRERRVILFKSLWFSRFDLKSWVPVLPGPELAYFSLVCLQDPAGGSHS
jgi:hypothetical protein